MSDTPRVDALIAKHREENADRLATTAEAVQQVRELIALARDLERASRPEERQVCYIGTNESGEKETFYCSVERAGSLLTDAFSMVNRLLSKI